MKASDRRSLPSQGEGAPNQIFAKIVRYIIGWPAVLLYRTTFEGVENIPEGPCIISGNHTSYLDAIAIFMTPRDEFMHYVAKEALYRNKLFSWIFDNLGGIPVNRGTADREMIRHASTQLQQGEKLVIFPEGTRGRERDDLNEIVQAHEGAAFLAIRNDVPIIPVGLSGFDKISKKGSILPRFPLTACKFGEPIYPGDFEGGRKERITAMTEKLMEEIVRLRDEAKEGIETRSRRLRGYISKGDT